jgi:hypothetical protein
MKLSNILNEQQQAHKLEIKTGIFKDIAISLTIRGLSQTDKITLEQKFNAKKDGFSTNGVYFTAPIKNYEPFLNGNSFNGMYKYLEGTGNYIMPDIELIKTDMKQALFDIIPSGAIKEQNERYGDLYENVIKSLDDPRTKELLQKISKIGFNINEEIYGKVRSGANAMRAYAVKPDATFVETRKGWRSFNRIIKSDATQILLLAPTSKNKDEKRAEEKFGVKRTDIADNPHKADSFRLNSYTTTPDTDFKRVVFFDVSDTVVFPGQEDLWTGKAGLVNNLQGELNQLAREEITNAGVEMKNLDIVSDNNKNTQYSKKLLSHIEANKSIPDQIIASLSKLDLGKDESVITILKAYLGHYSFDREHDENKKNAKINATIATCLTIDKVAEAERLKILKVHEDNIKNILNTRADFSNIAAQVNDIIRIMKDTQINAKSGINESEKNMVTPEDVMALFHVDPDSLEDGQDIEQEDKIGINESKEQYKTDFYKLFNKIK